MIPPSEALARLREGNRRFVDGTPEGHVRADATRRRAIASGQEPFAVVLGCADSRVPVEVVFDQGLGDLFVGRVAGCVASPEQVGSVELAAESLGVRLVVVLGHHGCAAVRVTLEAIDGTTAALSPSVRSIVERMREPVAKASRAPSNAGQEDLVERATRASVRASADVLRTESDVLRRLIKEDGLVVVGAVYSLESGVVEFFDGTDGIDCTDGAAERASTGTST